MILLLPTSISIHVNTGQRVGERAAGILHIIMRLLTRTYFLIMTPKRNGSIIQAAKYGSLIILMIIRIGRETYHYGQILYT